MATLECRAASDISLRVPPPTSARPRPRSAGRALVLAALLAALLGPTGCADRGPLSPPTLEPLVVHVDGRWIRDAKGRVVLLRGANVLGTHDEPPERRRPPRSEDFAFLAGIGFNLVRLPLTWASVEPRPAVYDFLFLREHFDPVLRQASDHGMQAIVALHQVRWSSCFLGGRGAPSWTCKDAAEGGERTAPPEPAWGLRDAVAELSAARAQCDFYRSARAPDRELLRAHYVDAWRALARYYEQDKRIAGFDLLNEPSPGSCFPVDAFTARLLTPLYAKARAAIRAEGAPQALLYEPAVSRTSPMAGIPPSPERGAIFAPHLFTQTFGAPDAGRAAAPDTLAKSYARAAEVAREAAAPLLVGEIGGDAPPDGSFRPSTLDFLARSLDELDRHLAGGAVWAFVDRGTPIPPSGGIGIGNEAAALVLARPYARRIAGIPLAMRFDAASREFTFRFADDPERRPPDPSEIFLPAKRRYPDGFVVEVTPGDRWVFDEHNQRVLLYRGPATTHDVRIRPADAATASPPAAR